MVDFSELKRRRHLNERESLEYKRDPVNWYPIFLRSISIYFTWFFLRLGVTATQVTILWGIFGISACFLVSTGYQTISIIGALLFQFAFFLDRVDGEIARYNRKFSAQGVFMDMVFEQIVLSLVFISATSNVFINTGESYYLIFGASAAFFIILNFNSIYVEIYVKQQEKSAIASKQYDFEDKKNENPLGFENKINTKWGMSKFVLSGINAFLSDSIILLLFSILTILGRLNIYLIVYGTLLPLQFVRKVYLRQAKLS